MAFTNMHSNDFASSAAVSVANSSVTSTTAGCGQLLRYLHPVPDRYQPCQLLRCCSFHHSGCTCSYTYNSTCPCTVSLGDCTADGIGTASDGAPARRTGQGLTFPYRSSLDWRCGTVRGHNSKPGSFFPSRPTAKSRCTQRNTPIFLRDIGVLKRCSRAPQLGDAQ